MRHVFVRSGERGVRRPPKRFEDPSNADPEGGYNAMGTQHDDDWSYIDLPHKPQGRFYIMCGGSEGWHEASAWEGAYASAFFHVGDLPPADHALFLAAIEEVKALPPDHAAPAAVANADFWVAIATADGVAVGRDDYVDATITTVNPMTLDIADRVTEIRGRGNSTWAMPKKPYQIKLDEKGKLLGMHDHEKKWIALQNYADKTHMRNAIAFLMGHHSKLSWTPQYRFAKLRLNGSDDGLYLFTQKVEDGPHRVRLGENGFLLEVDTARGVPLDAEDHPFDWMGTAAHGSQMIIKQPGLDLGEDDDKIALVQAFVHDFGVDAGASWDVISSIIDVGSFVDWYLISETSRTSTRVTPASTARSSAW